MFGDTFALLLAFCFNSVCVSHGIDNSLFTFFTWSFYIACAFWEICILFFTGCEWNFFRLCDFLSRHDWSFLSPHFNHFFNWLFGYVVALHNTICFNSVCVGNGINNSPLTFLTRSFHIPCAFWEICILFFTGCEWNFMFFYFFLSRHDWSFLSPHFNHFFNWLFGDTFALLLTFCFNSVFVGNGIDNGLFTFFTWSFHIPCAFWEICILFFTFCEWNFFRLCHFLSCDHRSFLSADFDDLINRLFSDRFALLLAFGFDTIG